MVTSPEYKQSLANVIHLKTKKRKKPEGIKRRKDPHLLTTYCIIDVMLVHEKNIVSFNHKTTLKVE